MMLSPDEVRAMALELLASHQLDDSGLCQCKRYPCQTRLVCQRALDITPGKRWTPRLNPGPRWSEPAG